MEAIGSVISRTLTNTAKLDLKCDKCGEHKHKKYGIYVLPRSCKCHREHLLELHKKQEKAANREAQAKLDRLKAFSMMDKRFSQCTFENYKVDDNNRKIFNFAKQYCENWDKMLKENMGLMLHGKQGIGKTYISFCIANYLIERYVPVIAISTIALLERIKKSYRTWGSDGEIEIINQLSRASLLILDDIGAENDTDWVKEKLYEIIDNRERQGKPLIITTNLTEEQLQEKLTGEDGVNRTYDRIVKMCQPIKVSGTSKRIDEAKRKKELLRELMA